MIKRIKLNDTINSPSKVYCPAFVDKCNADERIATQPGCYEKQMPVS